MAGERSGKINVSGGFSYGMSRRPIPKRGQVKVAIVLGLAQSFVSIFSLNLRNRCGGARLST
ncbi:hypothetical protein CRG98_018049 [Punica granatum]|uniref:Uncharacterized protein n=1 Tax=Punica granatum TaxID=22663 RepID=A0A2I0K0E1_PUNGR|nr:hypothetical protein CRG98_018049 [Punica granatum]